MAEMDMANGDFVHNCLTDEFWMKRRTEEIGNLNFSWFVADQ
jgi:hypothetical protein